MSRPCIFGMAFTLAAAMGLAQPATRVAGMLDKVGLSQKLGDRLPLELVFADETGREAPLSSYFRERPVILALVYYRCPMLCNLVVEGLLRSLNSISLDAGRQFEIVAVSIDPRETPLLAAEKLKNCLAEYARPAAAGGWHFLTGSQENITRLAEAVGFNFLYLPEEDQYAHPSGIMVATPEGRLSRYFFGVDYSPRDLRFGLVEASSNRIGGLIDQILLLCYHYDPVQGKYSLYILNVIRAAGILTVLVMTGFIYAMLARERRKRSALEPIHAE